LWVLHLNVSFCGRWWRHREETLAQLKALGCPMINGSISDVRKSTIQKLNAELALPSVRVSRDDGFFTKVIVKTDYNYGGIPESRLSPIEAENLGLLANAGCSIQTCDQYRVSELGQVAEAVWQDERFVVEKFIENEQNRICRFYRCGRRAVLSEAVNSHAIKKMLPGLPRQNWHLSFGGDYPTAHETLVRNATKMCERMMLEFGAMDIVIDQDGCPYIIDVNPTPGWGAEDQEGMLNFLRGGFDTPS
jgi:hypothetical protein